jgi:putative N6-adenine-specific DNA methylase
MDLFRIKSKIVVTCSNRLSPYLHKEAEGLGFKPDRVFKTGLEIYGDMKDCIKLNMNLRCASQVLFSIKSFKAFTAQDIYKTLLQIEWENIIKKDGYLCITSNVENDTIDNNLFANVKLKDAIVDRMKEKFGIRPDSGPERNKLVIHLFWRENQVSVFIDTSGETLSKHNYRK